MGIVLAIALFFFIAVGCYFFVNGPVTSKVAPATMVAFSFSTFIGAMQNVSVVANMNLSWPDNLKVGGGLWL